MTNLIDDMQLLAHSGSVSALCNEAIEAAKAKDYEGSRAKLAQAHQMLDEASHYQAQIRASLDFSQANSKTMLHQQAQSYFQEAMSALRLAGSICDLYERI